MRVRCQSPLPVPDFVKDNSGHTIISRLSRSHLASRFLRIQPDCLSTVLITNNGALHIRRLIRLRPHVI